MIVPVDLYQKEAFNNLIVRWLPKLRRTAFRVLMFAFSQTHFYPAQTTLITRGSIKKFTKLSKKSLKRAMEQLENLKLIVQYQQGGHYFYRVTLEAFDG